MDKPVSEPTAPAEPAPTLERNWKQGLPIGLAAIQQAKDAARYRWLRDTKNDFGPLVLDVKDYCDEYGHPIGDFLSNSELDAAIDAAMKGA